MKKQIHPQLAQSIIQLKDGSIFTKKWLFFRQQLFLEIDYGSHRFWKKKVSIIKKNTKVQ